VTCFIGPESSIRSFLGAGFQSMRPHLGHFCRLVLAAQSHDAHLQFTKNRPLKGRLSQFSPVPFENRVASAHHLDFDSQSENEMMFQTYNIGDGDFTFRLTLGIIPDPDLILGVLYHEATIVRWWIINSSHAGCFESLHSPKFHHRL